MLANRQFLVWKSWSFFSNGRLLLRCLGIVECQPACHLQVKKLPKLQSSEKLPANHMMPRAKRLAPADISDISETPMAVGSARTWQGYSVDHGWLACSGGNRSESFWRLSWKSLGANITARYRLINAVSNNFGVEAFPVWWWSAVVSHRSGHSGKGDPLKPRPFNSA